MNFLHKYLLCFIFYYSVFQLSAQDKVILFEQGRYNEYEIVLLERLNSNSFSKLSKEQRINTLVDLGKLRKIKKDYVGALGYLLWAKKLNIGDSLNYSHYNSVLGGIFAEVNASSIAIEYYKKEISKPGNHQYNYFQLNTLGSLFLKINEIDSAVFYFEKQLEEANLINDYVAQASANNNIGITKARGGDFHSAIKYFEKGIETIILNKNKKNIFYKDDNSAFLINIYRNLGECYYRLENYDKAIQYFEQCIQDSINLKDEIEFYGMSVNCYIHKNQIDKAKILISRVEKEVDDIHISDMILLNKMKLNLALAQNDTLYCKSLIDKLEQLEKKALIESRKEVDEMNKIVSHLLLTQANEQIIFEKQQKENVKKKALLDEREKKLTIFVLILVLIILLVLGVVLMQNYKNMNRKNQLEKQFHKLEEEKMKHKIKVQQNVLTDLSIEKRLKDSNTKELLKSLKHLQNYDSNDIQKEIDRLVNDIKQRERISLNFEELTTHSEKFLMTFKIKLLEIHPNLSEKEIDLCLLIKLNFTTKEIAAYKSITDASVKIFKHRLKTKMRLGMKQNLKDYLHNII